VVKYYAIKTESLHILVSKLHFLFSFFFFFCGCVQHFELHGFGEFECSLAQSGKHYPHMLYVFTQQEILQYKNLLLMLL
jgi:hypothetical protein